MLAEANGFGRKLAKDIGCFGVSNEGLGIVVVLVDVVADGHDQFLDVATGNRAAGFTCASRAAGS